MNPSPKRRRKLEQLYRGTLTENELRVPWYIVLAYHPATAACVQMFYLLVYAFIAIACMYGAACIIDHVIADSDPLFSL